MTSLAFLSRVIGAWERMIQLLELGIQRFATRCRLIETRPMLFASARFPLAMLLLACVMLTQGQAQENRSSDKPRSMEVKEREFGKTILPLLEAHCLDCHSDSLAEGDFSMEPYGSAESVLNYRNTFLKVLRRIEAGEMPPADSNLMSDDERKELVAWLDDHLNNIDCGTVDHPGTVTIRRLTRFEYRQTVRDLIGVDYEPAADFPADDVGYGFDNIGDVLSLPPLLMEKYLNAAEEIANEAIESDAYVSAGKQVITGGKLRTASDAGQFDGGAVNLFTNNTATAVFNVEHRGRYQIVVTAFGQPAGDDDPEMVLSIDNKEERTFKVGALADEPGKYQTREFLRSGDRRIQLAFTNDFYDADHPDPQRRDRNLIIKRVELIGPLDYRPTNLPETHRELIYVRPDDETDFTDAAKEIVTRLASRAYRRPATPEEIDKLVGLIKMAVDDGESFEAGVQLAVQAVLVSPHFLFKVEQPPQQGIQEWELNNFELATSLSYFLWSSMPDDELLLSAWNDELNKPAELEKQVKRMLQDPKADAFVENFSTQWLQLRALDQFNPDPELFPTFDEALKEDMRQETVLFFGNVVRNDRPIIELFNANYTFLNERLAEHYGIRGVRGTDFRQVNLRDSIRGGLLTQASILTVTSNPSRTSPVKRGKWIIENFLGEPPPPPAPDVMSLEDQSELTGTLRERMQQHRDNPACASCHAKMDPLGFALENFDALGRWRDFDGDDRIDAAGELPSGESFSGPSDLRRVLTESKQDQLVRCLVEKMLTYGLGRGLEYYDQCAIDEIIESASKDELRMSAIAVAIASSKPFRKRRVRQEEP